MVWRNDPRGAYRDWFFLEQRLKNFGSIRRGVQAVVDEIERGECAAVLAAGAGPAWAADKGPTSYTSA